MSDSITKYEEDIVFGQPGFKYGAKPKIKEDSIVQGVIGKYQERSNVGIDKYGVTLDRKDLNLLQWLTHLQEELMDATLYIEKLKRETANENKTDLPNYYPTEPKLQEQESHKGHSKRAYYRGNHGY